MALQLLTTSPDAAGYIPCQYSAFVWKRLFLVLRRTGLLPFMYAHIRALVCYQVPGMLFETSQPGVLSAKACVYHGYCCCLVYLVHLLLKQNTVHIVGLYKLVQA